MFPDDNGHFKLFLADNTELRWCADGHKRLKRGKDGENGLKETINAYYCSADGRFFHWYDDGKKLVQVKPCGSVVYGTFKASKNVHSSYPNISMIPGSPRAHLLMCTAWHGPRPEGRQPNGRPLYECDHLDGNVLNWRADNLQWVHWRVNCERAKILRARRQIAIEDQRPELLPANMSPQQLMKLYADFNLAGDVYEENENVM